MVVVMVGLSPEFSDLQISSHRQARYLNKIFDTALAGLIPQNSAIVHIFLSVADSETGISQAISIQPEISGPLCHEADKRPGLRIKQIAAKTWSAAPHSAHARRRRVIWARIFI
jgi:hypothetical protein